MQRSVFGLFTALLGVLCVLSAIPAFRKKRYGLAVFLLLNAFTNLALRHSCSKYPKVLLALVFQPSQPKLPLPFLHE